MQLIEDAHEDDVILVEKIDRLARLNPEDQETLKNLPVVSKELPTSYMALKSAGSTDFMSSSLKAINSMLLDMLAAIARKDYEDRRHRQQQGIAKAKAEGKYVGRKLDCDKRKIIASVLEAGHSYSDIQKTAKCSRQLIATVSKELQNMKT